MGRGRPPDVLSCGWALAYAPAFVMTAPAIPRALAHCLASLAVIAAVATASAQPAQPERPVTFDAPPAPSATPSAPPAAPPSAAPSAPPPEAAPPPAPAPAAAPSAESPKTEPPKEVAPPIRGMVEGETVELGARTLKGHTFAIPLLNDTPFVPTFFGVGTELGFYNQPGLKIPYIDETGATKKFVYDANAGFLRERFGLGIGLFDVAQIGVDADYIALVGANAESIFLFGGRTAFDVRPGARFRIARFEKTGTQIGVHGYGIVDGGIQLAPQGLLVEVVQALDKLVSSDKRIRCLAAGNFKCAFPSIDVFGSMDVRQNEYGGGGSFNIAQALGRHLGAEATVGIELSAPDISNKNFGTITSTAFNVYGGVAPTLNLFPILPVGGMLEYRIDFRSESVDKNKKAGIPAGYSETALNHGVAAGLFYTGRRDLMLGWILNGNFLRQAEQAGRKSSEQPLAAILTAQFTMRYFF